MDGQQPIQSFLHHGQTVRHLSERTLKAYESDLSQFSAQIGDQQIVNVTSAELEGYVGKLGEGTYRDTSIRRKVAALKVFFKYLEEHGFVHESPARKLKVQKPVENRLPNVLSMREVKSLLLALKQQMIALEPQQDKSPGARNRYFCAVRDNLIIELLFSTGIRIGELVMLDVKDVDLVERRVRITGRATRERYLQLGSQVLVGAFEDYLKLRAERGLEMSALFVGRSGTRLTIYSIENIFKKYAKSADIKRNVTPHSLRHTMAAMLINSGADIRDVQEILGHASILSTQIYTRLTPGKPKRSTIDLSQRDKISLKTGAPRLTIRKG